MQRIEHGTLSVGKEWHTTQWSRRPQWEAPGQQFFPYPVVPGKLLKHHITALHIGGNIGVIAMPGGVNEQVGHGRVDPERR